MPYTTIHADSRRPGICRHCGEAVEYARTPAGYPIALAPPVHLQPQQIHLWTGEAPILAVVISPKHRDVCRVRSRRRRR